MFESIRATDLKQRLEDDPSAVVLDVRTPAEFDARRVTSAKNMPLDVLKPADVPVTAGDIFVMCRTGRRSAEACRALAVHGVARVYNVEGGIEEWVRSGFPVAGTGAQVLPLERQVRIAAGLLVTVGVGLGVWLHPAWLVLPAFVGVGLTFAGLTDHCGMALLLGRMPWNRRTSVNAS